MLLIAGGKEDEEKSRRDGNGETGEQAEGVEGVTEQMGEAELKD